VAAGNPIPNVQWYISKDLGKTWNVLSGFTSTTENTGPLDLSENGWEGRAMFFNSQGTTFSDTVTVTVTL
jgi:hypothetical protein